MILARFLTSRPARVLYCDAYGHPNSESECNATDHWCGVCGTHIGEDQVSCEKCDAWWDYNLVDGAEKTCPYGHRVTL